MKPRQIFAFVTILLVVQILTHFVVYQGFVLTSDIVSQTALFWTRVIFSILPWAFMVGVFVSAKYNNIFTRVYYRVFAVWQGFLLYFFLASTIYILVLASGLNIPLGFGNWLFDLAFVVGVYGLENARKMMTTKVTVEIKNIPEVWKSKKVVWISDIHLGQINAEGYAKKVVEKVKSLSPDLVFIGGDLYDGVKVDSDKIIAPFKNLQTTQGVYFITGNHDGFTDASTVEDVHSVEKIGIKVLRDSTVIVDGVQIVGVDYRSTSTRNKYVEVLGKLNIDKNIPSILLKHIPSDIDVARDAGIGFQISGHTHRAQMWPLSYMPKIIYKGFDYGLKSLGDTKVYTSSGVGTWGPPLRVGTQSEVVLFDFK